MCNVQCREFVVSWMTFNIASAVYAICAGTGYPVGGTRKKFRVCSVPAPTYRHFGGCWFVATPWPISAIPRLLYLLRVHTDMISRTYLAVFRS
eukprot:scaffold82054_cov50-Cyclotella_meneghiniana.AAC.1